MHKKLILLAFEKAKEEEQKRGVKKPSDTSLAINLSIFIKENSDFSLGEKSLRNYYKSALKEEETSIKQLKVINALCRYLGHDNYQEFAKQNDVSEKIASRSNQKITVLKKKKISLIILFLTILSVFTIIYINKTRWMIWQDDHYETVNFNLKEYDINQLKKYKKDHVLNFSKIEPDCSTIFFKDDGSENLWYEKNLKGELEYFTDLGSHPETGKTLKKITKYMIRTYICETY